MPSAAAPAAGTTFTYELVGDAEDFRRHANTVVTVRGREDMSVAREAEHEREAEGQARGAASTDATPTVEVKEEADIKVRRLHASNVLGTGDACPSLGGDEGRATEAPRTQQ